MERPGREPAAHREEVEVMNARRATLGALIIAGLALPTSDAHACGGMAMAMPMAGHAMLMPSIGMTVEALPEGFISVTVNGVAFFRAGTVWYQQVQGPTGPVYQVVPAPHGM
jgi:hypothetical protein